MIEVDVNIQVPANCIEADVLCRAVQELLEREGFESAQVSLAIVDDATIHELNRRHLDHDYATDVLSFIFEHGERTLSGEVIASADTAATSARQYGWKAADELLLYVVHGTLHLAGYDDRTDEERAVMRRRETEHLRMLGVERPALQGESP